MSGCFSQTVLSLFKPDELVLEKQWLEIRDIFCGHNRVKQDITRALELAAACDYKEAQWLTRVFAGKTVSTREARDIFFALGEYDARGLCFAALLDDDDTQKWHVVLMSRSAELGCAFAQALMADETDGEEGFRLATFAAAQRERDGFYLLGSFFKFGRGCENNKDRARENYLIAAELGLVAAMTEAGLCFDESSPQRWFWLGRVAKLGSPYWFSIYFSSPVQQFESGAGNAASVFQIGRALNGHEDVEKRAIL
jgi:TPR repeat protein